ncbi:hypothetical protein OEZ86_013128 [Tetradesmus obliquus]|nr:hypothetical protein OEZ86_013128 [Tetradesmus obliquus]
MSWSDPLHGNPRYESIRTLSTGTRSFVQLAVDRSTGEQVAIKFTQRGWDDNQMKYLLRELLIHQELSACRHPHIVELRDVFLTPLHLAAVCEFVDGEDLQLFLANTGGRVSEALGRFLFQQLVLALDFVHRRGKVCRGVKLANTLLALAPGQLPLVKLADFGFSKDVGQHGAPQSQVGTALFVAPEVMHNFNHAPYDGAAVDVWAAGIVLFILLFGRHPFLRPEDSSLPEQQQMLALFTRTAASQFCLLPEEALAITPACADLLSHVLQTNPASRYGMAQIQAHPWFKQGLPEGAAAMNETILADVASRPISYKQAPEVLAAMLRAGQMLDPSLLAQRFASSAAAAAVPASSGGRALSGGPVSGGTASAGSHGIAQQQQQQGSWGAPPPPQQPQLMHAAATGQRRSDQLPAATADDEDANVGDLEIPEDYAAFLVDDDELAEAAAASAQRSSGGGAAAATLRRKRLLSSAGAGVSSFSQSLDLRQLSDMLMQSSEAQLLEGSMWHKICRDLSFRGTSLLAGGSSLMGGASGGSMLGGLAALRAAAAAADAAAEQGGEEAEDATLQGLRAMSITK